MMRPHRNGWCFDLRISRWRSDARALIDSAPVSRRHSRARVLTLGAMWLLRSCLVAIASSALFARVASPQARVLSTVSSLPAVAAAAANTISVSVGSGAVQSLANVVDNTPNTFPTPVSITLTWDLHPSTGSVQVL